NLPSFLRPLSSLTALLLSAAPTLFPYTTLFRSIHPAETDHEADRTDEPGDPDKDLDDLQRGHDAAPAWSRAGLGAVGFLRNIWRDRKSTRLNSSHEWISYAVFCLKKKKRHYVSV